MLSSSILGLACASYWYQNELAHGLFIHLSNLLYTNTLMRLYRLQPYIFDIVVLGSTDAPLFRRSVNSMPAQFFATHVKNLCLSVSVEPEDATTILRVCRGVKNLAFWVDHLANPSARSHSLSLIATLHLHRLSTEITYYLDLIRSDSQQQAWVQRLTHLDVIFGTHGPEDGQEGPSPQTVVPHLDQLPRLTHLGLRPSWTRPPVSKADLRAMLDAALSLVVLVIYDESGIGHERVSSVDRRVVYIPYPPNVILEWEGQAHGDEMSVWTKAEGLVRRHAAEQRGVYFCQDS